MDGQPVPSEGPVETQSPDESEGFQASLSDDGFAILARRRRMALSRFKRGIHMVPGTL